MFSRELEGGRLQAEEDAFFKYVDKLRESEEKPVYIEFQAQILFTYSG
jgi:hypothetical protein